MQLHFEAADNLQGAGLFWHNIQCGTTSTLNIISDMCHLILVVDPSRHSKTQELGSRFVVEEFLFPQRGLPHGGAVVRRW